MMFLTEIRAYEIYEAFADADFDVLLKLRRFSVDSRGRNSLVGEGHFYVEVEGVHFNSDSSSFRRLVHVCEYLGVGWEAGHGERTVRIVPLREEWLPSHRALKEASKREKGFCAACEQEVRKQANSALCEQCIADERYRARFG
jgi:hypothetical protein